MSAATKRTTEGKYPLAWSETKIAEAEAAKAIDETEAVFGLAESWKDPELKVATVKQIVECDEDGKQPGFDCCRDDVNRCGPVFQKLSPPEKSRKYVFADGYEFAVNDVVAVSISKSGTHRLELADGMKVIVASGWRAIILDVPQWTF